MATTASGRSPSCRFLSWPTLIDHDRSEKLAVSVQEFDHGEQERELEWEQMQPGADQDATAVALDLAPNGAATEPILEPPRTAAV